MQVKLSDEDWKVLSQATDYQQKKVHNPKEKYFLDTMGKIGMHIIDALRAYLVIKKTDGKLKAWVKEILPKDVSPKNQGIFVKANK